MATLETLRVSFWENNMSDIEPNRQVELKRMEVERDGMKLRYQQQELRLLEIDDEKVRIRENMEATKKEVSNMDGVIKQLKENLDKPKQED